MANIGHEGGPSAVDPAIIARIDAADLSLTPATIIPEESTNLATHGVIFEALDQKPEPTIQERFNALTLIDQNSLLTGLYREGNLAGVARLRPDFEMDYPLSDGEKISFEFFERYIQGKIEEEDQGLLEAIGQRSLGVLMVEQQNPGIRFSNDKRPEVLGYKLARYDRYKIETGLEREQAEVLRLAA